MDHQTIKQRLDGFVDGDLSADEARIVDEHLAGCDACRRELDALRALTSRAAELPRSVEPPSDLWPRIRQSIEAEKVVTMDFTRRKRIWITRLALAAAAVFLVVASSGVTALYLERVRPTPVNTQPRPVATLVAFSGMEEEVERATTEFEQALTLRGASLQPETVELIRRNLAVIDRAIAESRAALRDDPHNADLSYLLALEYRDKVSLLRNATQLTTEI